MQFFVTVIFIWFMLEIGLKCGLLAYCSYPREKTKGDDSFELLPLVLVAVWAGFLIF
jgi:hypothetical protein